MEQWYDNACFIAHGLVRLIILLFGGLKDKNRQIKPIHWLLRVLGVFCYGFFIMYQFTPKGKGGSSFEKAFAATDIILYFGQLLFRIDIERRWAEYSPEEQTIRQVVDEEPKEVDSKTLPLMSDSDAEEDRRKKKVPSLFAIGS